jgi:hypothetical protein
LYLLSEAKFAAYDNCGVIYLGSVYRAAPVSTFGARVFSFLTIAFPKEFSGGIASVSGTEYFELYLDGLI